MRNALVLDKASFEQGMPFRTLYEQILEFLTKNSGKAYNDAEISRQILQVSGPDGVLRSLTIVGQQAYLHATLDNLIADGKIAARKPGIFVYYMAVQPDAELTSTEKHEDETPT